MAWSFSIGNLVSRAPRSPAAVSPAVEDSIMPLSNLGSGYPDQQGALQWRSGGDYAIDFDLNLLAEESERADAPTGWVDLLNSLSGTPGLPANPPDWGTYGGRATALRLFRPVVQEIDVMPGETVQLDLGVYRPTGATGATGVQVRVVDRSTGKGWDGAYGAWTEGGILTEQTTADTWLDIAEEIEADPDRTERTTYLVVIEPLAASYDATSYVYASANGGAGSPALYAEVDTVALIGHELPADATVALEPQPSGTALDLTVAQPSAYEVGAAAQLAQVWRLTVQMPAGVQPRAEFGEVWIGTARTLLVGAPVLPIGLTESAPGQLSLEAGRKRREVVPDTARPVVELELQFKARNDAAYQQIRDEIARLTRFGAEPMLLMPGATFEGAGRVYHGRVEDEVKYSVVTPVDGGSLRTFTLPFVESPFAAP